MSSYQASHLAGAAPRYRSPSAGTAALLSRLPVAAPRATPTTPFQRLSTAAPRSSAVSSLFQQFRLPIPSIPSFQTSSPVPNVLPPSSTGVPVVSTPSAATAETPAQVQAEIAGVSATGDKKIPVVLIAGVGIAVLVAYFVFKKKGA